MKRLAPAFLVFPLAMGGAHAFGQQDAAPRVWAVVVSVEEYQAPTPGRLGLGSDGKQLARWIKETAGWGNASVLELNDGGNPRPGQPSAQAPPLLPTRSNLDWALEKWVGSRANPGDVVLFAFSGRGGKAKAVEGLLPIDYRSGDEVWSPERAIERLIRDSRCSSVLCWIDAPMLGPDGPGTSIAEAGDQLLRRLARWPQASAWMASGQGTLDSDGGFGAALRASLGDGRKTLLASLSDLNRDSRVVPLRFRHLGGVPGDLCLARELFHAPRKQRAELLVQRGHADRVSAIAFRADGRAMMTASDDSTIRVWDPAESRRALLRVLPEFLNGVSALALSPDGRFLAGGDGMGQVLAWDLSSPNPRPIALDGLSPHQDLIKALEFLPDEPAGPSGKPRPSRFVSLGQNGRAEVWEIDDRVMGHRVALSPKAKDLKLSAASKAGGPSTFAIVGDDGVLHVFDRLAEEVRAVSPLPGVRPTALRVEPGGRWAVLGYESGQVKVVDLASAKVSSDQEPLPSKVSSIRIGPGQLMAIGSGSGVCLSRFARPKEVVRLEAGREEIESVDLSTDGRWLAALDSSGQLFAWKLSEDAQPASIPLDRAGGKPASFASFGFGPASGPPMLAAGEADGGVRRWDLRAGKEWPRIEPHRGKVRQLSVTPDGRRLLQVTGDGVAQVWDLKEGRGVRTLDGFWSSGTFLPDGRLAMARHPDSGGGVAIESKPGRPEPDIDLPLPPDGLGDFGRLVASKDGRRVAASAAPGHDEVVIVWDLTAVGPPRVIHAHDRALTALDFSDDGKTLLTGGEDGQVKLWDLGAQAGPKLAIREPSINAVTAARFGPGADLRVVFAGMNAEDQGFVFSWGGKVGPDGTSLNVRKLGETNGRVQTVAYLAGGRHVAAAGRDGRIRAWELAEGKLAAPLDIVLGDGQAGADGTHHHSESINDLLGWPILDGPSLVSGSDDSTVRFWKLTPDSRSRLPNLLLLGTITSAPEGISEPVGKLAKGRVVEAPWVVFTPQNVYDASFEGEGLVSFSDGRGVEPLDQYAPRLFHPLLTDNIRRGVSTPPQSYAPPPPLLIESPEDRALADSDTEVEVSFGDRDLKADDLRLYLNGLPIRSGDGFRETREGHYVANVSLIRGDNRLYAMAGRRGQPDARSKDLVLFVSKRETPGRLHVISLGVGKYARNALEYPVADARDFAGFVQGHGLGSSVTMGERIILSDDKVDAPAVQKAFQTVRRKVQGHPEDTVVVFLAGHTDILAGPDSQPRYSLLLPRFPFPASDPIQVAQRGPGVGSTIREAPEGTYLPYANIYKHFGEIDALQRLVIVDACQAAAVLDDPAVRLLDQIKAMDQETRQSRTNYFLASRRGEAAGESNLLRHGLLTYVMLRGMGDANLPKPPEGLVEFQQLPTADLDGDGVVTTLELHRYVDQTLPPLADRLAVVTRGSGFPIAGGAGNPPPAGFVATRVAASGPSFPLISISPR